RAPAGRVAPIPPDRDVRQQVAGGRQLVRADQGQARDQLWLEFERVTVQFDPGLPSVVSRGAYARGDFLPTHVWCDPAEVIKLSSREGLAAPALGAFWQRSSLNQQASDLIEEDQLKLVRPT